MQHTKIDWTGGSAAEFGRQVLLGRHELNQTGLFDRDALIALVDRLPARQVQVNTMGDDPTDTDGWAYCDARGLGGRRLLTAVDTGRLWVNLLDVGAHDPSFDRLLQGILEGLRETAPHLQISRVKANVLVSSPGALVHYHADPEPNTLWQLTGVKRVWVYPLDEATAPVAALEQVFAGGEEELPYDPAWDVRATVVDLEPGSVVTWQQNAPHRVQNLVGTNVSLSLSYYTPAAERRMDTFAANFFLGRLLPVTFRSTRAEGPGDRAKVLAFKALRRAGLSKLQPLSAAPKPVAYRVEPGAPLGRVPVA